MHKKAVWTVALATLAFLFFINLPNTETAYS